MGLSESKKPFEEDGDGTIFTITKSQTEIGITQMLDPRSPSCDFERTPVRFYNERRKSREEDAGDVVIVTDPRSPSNEIQRTPLRTDDDEEFAETKELRVRIQRLKLFDTPVLSSTDSTESLSSNKEVINPTKTILKFLESNSLSENNENFDSGFPSSPPRPRSRSTPKEVPTPETPASSKKETATLLKKKRRGQNKGRRQAEKLQKSVVKKAFTTEHTPRSPLSERNRDRNDGKSESKKIGNAKIKYNKYKTLNESLTGEIFTGKENEEFVW